jgi:ABC-2 type transport system permease protein
MRLLTLEIYKVFIRRRSYIGFIAIFFVVILLLLAVNYEAESILSFITTNLKNAFSFKGNLINGNLFAHIVLRSLWVHIPILVVMVTGDLVSGEYQTGTFRMVLSRPVSRIGLISSKFAAGSVYVIILVLFLSVVSLGLGFLFLGNGDLLVAKESIFIFNSDDTLWRFALAYLFGILSMLTVAFFSMLMSTLFENSVTAILTSLATVIVLTFLSTFNIPVIENIKPFLFTSYMSSWQSFFDFNINFSQIIIEAVVLIVHICVFYFLSVYFFVKKDILT